MRSFLILCSVVAAANAASLGYNYEANSGPALGGGLSGPSYGGPSYGGPALSVPSFGGQGLAGPSYSGPSAAGPSYSGPSAAGPSSFGGLAPSGPSYSAPAAAPAPVEVNKEFFTYTAPEHEFNDAGDAGDHANSLKKNLRVIFIKGPENSGLENAALQLAKSAGEERTAIYVLSKQADIGDLANKLQSLNHRNSQKPEVHFVKYRTPADAENAKQAIQSQYDGLGGNTSSHNGGVAPVLDFASKAPAPVAPAAQQYGAAPVGGAENAYLPPNKRV
ncbi:CCR4-NOT transcription complex subunit 3-like [Bactrocera dorsalis]|uniref:CCR4-NOT transcription complex subunit 3-like n=1 Tax=Bactrocera dorsalis TaxID=27457 RepID=A0ABM3J1H7_BACDO|nr:CCR4-NOT transcription complex subunit 3-like [Bactrocera dorsalis]